jgi:hypothetical protein
MSPAGEERKMVKSLFSTGHMSAIGTSGAKLTQHDDMEMKLLAWQDNTALRRAPSGQG